MARISIRLPDNLDERVEDALEYGDTKSEFYRQAAEEKLAREAIEGEPAEEAQADS